MDKNILKAIIKAIGTAIDDVGIDQSTKDELMSAIQDNIKTAIAEESSVATDEGAAEEEMMNGEEEMPMEEAGKKKLAVLAMKYK